MFRVTIFGTGYVGLVTGTCLAEVGHHVTCVDIDENKVKALKDGYVSIYEPGLVSMVRENAADGRLHFTTDAGLAVQEADVIFIAVGTPSGEDGNADLSHVLQVAETIGQNLAGPAIIANKSTVPVGTAEKVDNAIRLELAERGEEFDYEVVSNPEFLKEGAAIEDCMRPDRIIIGTGSRDAAERLRRLYAPFNRNRDRIITMDVHSAELTKYAANAMLAAKISFMNEMANIAENVGADIEMIRQGIGSDPRIGWHFIYPGAGYGGSCLPKDVRALAKTATENGMKPELILAVESVNNRQKEHLFELICRHYGGAGALKGKVFALWGLAFKPNTDDMREASSLVVIAQLKKAGATIRAFDPEASESARRILSDDDAITYCERAEDAVRGANALVIVTEWKQFRSPDFGYLREELSDQVIFDGRNLYEPKDVEIHNLIYYATGRGRSLNKRT